MQSLSAVIELLDRHRDLPALGAAPHFRLNGMPVLLLMKPQARYVLTGLAPGDYKLDVSTATFEPYQLSFTVRDGTTLSERRWQCSLVPGRYYDYPPHSTLIRGRLASTVRGELTISANYHSARGRPRRVETRCKPHQSYTLVLPGKLAIPTQVTLRFEMAGGISRERQLAVMPGQMQQVDDVFEMDRSIDSTSRGRG